MKRLDWYIIRKFLGTYFFTIALVLSIAIVLDYTNKADRFAQHEAPWGEIVNYYLCFIPYFAALFSPLFIFVACIYFTSGLAGDSEIIAMLATGISFSRLCRPYFIGALFIAVLNFILVSFVIPPTSQRRIDFLNTYSKDKRIKTSINNQMMVEPGVVFYLYRFDTQTEMGNRFALERYVDGHLAERLVADRAAYRGDSIWHLSNWNLRTLTERGEDLQSGAEMDTLIRILPSDLVIQTDDKDFEKMTTPRLREYIDHQKRRGVGGIKDFEIEYHKRWAAIGTSFLLTFIGVCLSSRKVRGGMGINLGIGLVLAFVYILFQTVSSSFAVSGDMPVVLAVWLPGIAYLPIAWYCYKYKAPR